LAKRLTFPDTIEKLVAAFNKETKALYYCDLKFMDDGPKLVKLNEWLVRWRSNILKMPFGWPEFWLWIRKRFL